MSYSTLAFASVRFSALPLERLLSPQLPFQIEVPARVEMVIAILEEMRSKYSYPIIPSAGTTWCNFLTHTLIDLRLPDLGRNEKIASDSCHSHMLCAKDGYASCHNGYITGRCMVGRITPHQTIGYY